MITNLLCKSQHYNYTMITNLLYKPKDYNDNDDNEKDNYYDNKPAVQVTGLQLP